MFFGLNRSTALTQSGGATGASPAAFKTNTLCTNHITFYKCVINLPFNIYQQHIDSLNKSNCFYYMHFSTHFFFNDSIFPSLCTTSACNYANVGMQRFTTVFCSTILFGNVTSRVVFNLRFAFANSTKGVGLAQQVCVCVWCMFDSTPMSVVAGGEIDLSPLTSHTRAFKEAFTA